MTKYCIRVDKSCYCERGFVGYVPKYEAWLGVALAAAAAGKWQHTLRQLIYQQVNSLSALDEKKLGLTSGFINCHSATVSRSRRCWTAIGRPPSTSQQEPRKNGGTTAAALLAAVAAGNPRLTLGHLYYQQEKFLSTLNRGMLGLTAAFISCRTATVSTTRRCWTTTGRSPSTI